MSLLSRCGDKKEIIEVVKKESLDILKTFNNIIKEAMDVHEMMKHYNYINDAFNMFFKLDYYNNALQKMNVDYAQAAEAVTDEDFFLVSDDWETLIWELKDQLNYINHLMSEIENNKNK